MGGEVVKWQLSQSRFGYNQLKTLSETIRLILRSHDSHSQVFHMEQRRKLRCFSNNNRILAPIVGVCSFSSLYSV